MPPLTRFNGERIPDNQRSDCTYRSVRGNHPTLGSFYPCPVPGGGSPTPIKNWSKRPPCSESKMNHNQTEPIRRDRNGPPVFDWLLQRVALEESFREVGAPPHATPADDPKPSIEGTNDDTQASGEDTDDSPQTEYTGEVYRDLIGQLGTKDKQIARKDTQLDNTIQRNGELNVLLQGYQKRLGALPPPTDIREHVTGETEEEPTTNAL